ncbi:hypothetical protein BDW68DRAFT_195145 [Aspergillus falconensis]
MVATIGKLIFVFISGAWHTADTFGHLRSLMAEHESEAIASPSVSPPNPTRGVRPVNGLHLDIKHAKAAIQALVDKRRQVVVITHSYGGAVGACAGKLGALMRSKDDNGYVCTSNECTVFYSDLSPEEQQKRIVLLKPQPMLSSTEPTLYEPRHDIPFMYLFCDNDLGFPLAAQEALAKSQPGKVIEGLRLPLDVGREQSRIAGLGRL